MSVADGAEAATASQIICCTVSFHSFKSQIVILTILTALILLLIIIAYRKLIPITVSCHNFMSVFAAFVGWSNDNFNNLRSVFII